MSSPASLHHFNEFLVLICSIEAALLPHALSVLDELSAADLCLGGISISNLSVFKPRCSVGSRKIKHLFAGVVAVAALVRLVGAVFVFFTAYVSPLFLQSCLTQKLKLQTVLTIAVELMMPGSKDLFLFVKFDNGTHHQAVNYEIFFNWASKYFEWDRSQFWFPASTGG